MADDAKTTAPADADEKAREKEAKKQAYVKDQVAKAHTEELPKLGGPIVDDWKPS